MRAPPTTSQRTHTPFPHSLTPPITPNYGLVEQPPGVGRGIPNAPLVYHHYGSLPSYLSSVSLVRSTKSAIVVLSNTLAKLDAPNFLGQLLLEALLEIPKKERRDFAALAEKAATNQAKQFPEMFEQLDRDRTPETATRSPLSVRAGKY
jgi:hypothetical protein